MCSMTATDATPREPRVAPLQLALGGADRLAALLEESGEPLAPERAAGALLALPRGPGELARRVLDEVVRDDARLVSHDDGRVGLVGLAPPPRRRCASRLDGRRPRDDGRRARARASSRSAPCGIEGGEQVGHVLAPRRPGRADAAAHHAAHGHPRSRPRGRRAAAARRWPSSSGSRGAACSSPTTRASTSASWTARSCALDGTRIGMRVLDTVALARRLLAGRIARCDLARCPIAST